MTDASTRERSDLLKRDAKSDPYDLRASRMTNVLLAAIVATYALARILEVSLRSFPQTLLVAFDVVSALAFALVHGSRHYGLRGIGVFVAICLIVGNVIENIGVLTGFPFGRYFFADLMGPKLFHVPILLGCAYIGMAYVSFILARIILGPIDPASTGAQPLALPFAASFIMVAWDVAQDPVWATVLHGWIWRDGGPWFGVPVSNYFGWFLNVFLIYLSFKLFLSRRPARHIRAENASWTLAVLFYAVCAAGNVLQCVPTPNPAIVADPTGKLWRVTDITGASALISIFVMGAFAVFAWARLGDLRKSIRTPTI